MLDRASLAGRFLCAVWQSEHIATDDQPSSVALPWKLSRKDSISSLWQSPHSLGISLRTAAEVGSATPCSLMWQSTQTGPLRPSFHAMPCALSSCQCLSTSVWQAPQVSGDFRWPVFALSSACFWMLCVPWQSLQDGDAWVKPDLSSPWPCTLFLKPSTTSSWHLPQVLI